jgi:hypothetical protein
MKTFPITAFSLAALALTAMPAWAVAPDTEQECEGKAADCEVPAPLLGAGLPGLAVLAAGGVGYLALRRFRRRQS